MGRNWVYRRPYFRVAKPKIPLTRRGTPLYPRHRRFFRIRRVVVAHKAAAIVAAISGVTAAAAVGHVIVGRRRVNLRPPRPQAAHNKIILKRPGEGKVFVFGRILKAINRMRRKMQQRLRWKPREIPPEITPPTAVISNPRGSVFSAGSLVGDIFSAGTKRGSVY